MHVMSCCMSLYKEKRNNHYHCYDETNCNIGHPDLSHLYPHTAALKLQSRRELLAHYMLQVI